MTGATRCSAFSTEPIFNRRKPNYIEKAVISAIINLTGFKFIKYTEAGMKDGRLTVGLFVADMADDFSRGICKGAIDAAYDADANLIIIPGNYFDRDLSIYDSSVQFDYQNNVLFTYASPDEMDLLVISVGTIGYMSSPERRKAFLDYFNDIPIITIASDIEGYEYVMYDNARGVRDAVDYLIGQGRKKIACLAGFTDNSDAAERLNAYRETLEANGIRPDDRLVEYCNMTSMCGDEVERLFKRTPDIDAIVCVNDETARAVYDYLNRTGRTIGRDVAVVGFDDLSYAYKMNPPLATVRANSADLGVHAVREGLKHLKTGEPVNRSVPTTFIKRASAGPENIENQVSVAEFDVNIEKMLMDLRTTNRAAKEMFSFNKYVDQNYAALLTGMTMLGIDYCYLYLLPSPVIHLQTDKWNKPDELMMKACLYGGNAMVIPRYRQVIPANKMYSHSLMPKGRRYTMIMIDLFSTDMQYGVAMMEFHFDKHYCIEALGYQMSAAVRMLQLMQTQEQTQRQLEENLSQLEENNINLNIEAFSDRLTGLLNRRGFEERADELLIDISNQGKYILVAYADMDNLKIINDRFGHREGDFALRACADMLREVFDGDDIIGRIGGDEYAVVSLRDEPVNMKELRERAALCMAEFNQESDRPYNVRFTIGGYTQSFLQGCRLSNMLENADNDLYEAKKLRDKDVMKS